MEREERQADESLKIARENANPGRVLPGEDMSTSLVDDAEHWIAVYQELLDFKDQILAEHRDKIARSPVLEGELGAIDVPFLNNEIDRLTARRDAWQRRRDELQPPAGG